MPKLSVDFAMSIVNVHLLPIKNSKSLAKSRTLNAGVKKHRVPGLSFLAPIELTDLKTWMAGSAEKLKQSGRHIGPVKKPS